VKFHIGGTKILTELEAVNWRKIDNTRKRTKGQQW